MHVCGRVSGGLRVMACDLPVAIRKSGGAERRQAVSAEAGGRHRICLVEPMNGQRHERDRTRTGRY
jgi:hypothetical protein